MGKRTSQPDFPHPYTKKFLLAKKMKFLFQEIFWNNLKYFEIQPVTTFPKYFWNFELNFWGLTLIANDYALCMNTVQWYDSFLWWIIAILNIWSSEIQLKISEIFRKCGDRLIFIIFNVTLGICEMLWKLRGLLSRFY